MKQPGKDCEKCGRPEITQDMGMILTLHQRCESRKCLPYAGGLMDQPSWIMELFDVIDAGREKHRRMQREESEIFKNG